MSFFDNLRSVLRQTLTAPGEARTTGLPTSSNGASSMHLHWRGVPRGVRAVEVDLELTVAPATPHLRFWALQASFVDGASSHGAGHLGLQWIGGYPGHTAVNWGGYRNGGGELSGSESALPSARSNANTRNYKWEPGSVYGLRIDEGSIGWRGSIIDRRTGQTTVVRELACPGSELEHIVMWSEIFAPCDAAPLTVAWSNASAITNSGSVPITSFSVSYQSVANGGCSNTNVSVASDGRVIQTSNTHRTNPTGSVIVMA